MKQKILITGCAGFIGFHVAKYFCTKGYDIIGVDNINSYYSQSLKKTRLDILLNKKNFTFLKNDISNTDFLNSLFDNNSIKFVLHFAAQAGVRFSIENPKIYIDTNIGGFLNILQECKKHGINLFYASSSSVYGDNINSILNEKLKTDSQVSIYGVTKKTNELMAKTYFNSFNVNSIGLRFFTVYGPLGRPDMAYYKFTKKIINNENIEVYNKGNHYRSFTYIDDVVESVYLLYKKFQKSKKFNDIYNIGSSKSESLNFFIKTIEKKLNKQANIKYLSKQNGDVKNTASDSSKLNKLISFTPKIDIKEGLNKFIDWYLKYYNKSL